MKKNEHIQDKEIELRTQERGDVPLAAPGAYDAEKLFRPRKKMLEVLVPSLSESFAKALFLKLEHEENAFLHIALSQDETMKRNEERNRVLDTQYFIKKTFNPDTL